MGKGTHQLLIHFNFYHRKTNKQKQKQKPKNYQPCIAKEKHSGKMRPYEERFGMPSKFYKTRNKKKQPSR